MATKKSITYEEVLAGFKELTKAQERREKESKRREKENAEGMKELRKAQERREKENAEGMKELRKAIQLTEEARREGEKVLRESQRETEKVIRESRQETEKALRELSKSLNEANGNFNNKWGKFLESLVKGDLVKLLDKRNIKVDIVRSRLIAYDSNRQEIGEFDLVAVNSKEIVAVEVKTTLTKEKVKKSIDHFKMFKTYFPAYADKVLYGGVAFLCEPEDKEARGAAKYAEENGLFVILSPGGEGNVSTMSNSKDFKPKAF